MGYTALYRKWRPMTFEEVVGQKHITTTIKNQIKNDNVAHAYLFCGTRGTGKTSIAKIFARAINCLNPQDFNPCNECEICTGILSENLMDVIEIDAASNNGVDNIRELRENIKYPPSKSRYKVYIIDEVHMLSQGAFNALLKTLEEPPNYAKFILATTEPHKIPATILSRCQRYDFKRITYGEILERLKYICDNSGITVDDKALGLIARNSDGAVRDALSILDQCISFCEDELTYEKAIETLGFTTDEFLFKLTDEIHNRNSEGCMRLIDELINNGKDVEHFLKDLINHFRNLLMTKMSHSLEDLLNMSNESIDRLKDQSKELDINTLIRFINILSEAGREIKWSNQPRILLELVIIKLLQPRLDESYEGLLDRIKDLEGKIKQIEAGTPIVQNTRTNQVRVKEEKQESLKTNNNVNNNESIKEQKESIDIETTSKDIKENELEEDLITPANSNLNFNDIQSKWEDILKEIKRRKISTYAVIMEGKLAALEGNRLVLVFKEGFWFHKETTSKQSNSDLIEQCILDFTNQNVKLKCVMEDEYQMPETNEDAPAKSEVEKEVEKVKEYFAEFQDKLEIIE